MTKITSCTQISKLTGPNPVYSLVGVTMADFV
jgi:hypothetical protein